jgi:hypothetical protein
MPNAAGYKNSASGGQALISNTTGVDNTANGYVALFSNTGGDYNTASGNYALYTNTTGNNNTALGYGADVSTGNLTNATAIGAGATVNATNKVRIGNMNVTVIEGQVDFTYPSDRNLKENFLEVDGEHVLNEISQINLTSWNYKGHDPFHTLCIFNH